MQNRLQSMATSLVDEFIAALDERRTDDWLALFTSQGYYALLRRLEFTEDNNYLAIGEDMKRLRARVESALERDLRRTAHMISGVRFNERTMQVIATFALWYDGIATYAGQYQFDLAIEKEQLLIKKSVVILDNAVYEAPILYPI